MWIYILHTMTLWNNWACRETFLGGCIVCGRVGQPASIGVGGSPPPHPRLLLSCESVDGRWTQLNRSSSSLSWHVYTEWRLQTQRHRYSGCFAQCSKHISIKIQLEIFTAADENEILFYGFAQIWLHSMRVLTLSWMVGLKWLWEIRNWKKKTLPWWFLQLVKGEMLCCSIF